MNKPTMLQDIYRRGLKQLSDAEPTDIARGEAFLEHLQTAVPIVADNVSVYLKNKGSLDVERDLPSIAPPFERFWIEYDHPGYGDFEPLRVGALFRVAEFDDYDEGAVEADRMVRKLLAAGKQRKDDKVWDTISDPVRWVMAVDICFRFSPDMPIGPIKTWFVAVCPDGSVAHAGDHYANVSAFYGPHSLLTNDYLRVASQSLDVALLTLSFMHCRNVVQTDHLPSRQERRELDRHNQPIIKYKTLQIEPMKQVLATEGGIATNGLKKALHICRGHFSHYSDEKPLFGKYSGSFWIPAHVRGTTESGQVVKDYSVKAPRKAA